MQIAHFSTSDKYVIVVPREVYIPGPTTDLAFTMWKSEIWYPVAG